jgi:hypothetical protein
MAIIDDTIKLTSVLLNSDRPKLRLAARLAITEMTNSKLAKAITEVLGSDSPPVSDSSLASRLLDLDRSLSPPEESFSDFLERVRAELKKRGLASTNFLGEIKRGPTANDGSETSEGFRHDLLHAGSDSAGMSFSMYDIALAHRRRAQPDPLATRSISLALSATQVAEQRQAAEKQQPALSPAKHAEAVALFAGVSMPSARIGTTDTHQAAVRLLGKGMQFSTQAPAPPTEQEAAACMAVLSELASLAPYTTAEIRQEILGRTRELHDAGSRVSRPAGNLLEESRALLARARATVR